MSTILFNFLKPEYPQITFTDFCDFVSSLDEDFTRDYSNQSGSYNYYIYNTKEIVIYADDIEELYTRFQAPGIANIKYVNEMANHITKWLSRKNLKEKLTEELVEKTTFDECAEIITNRRMKI